MAKKIAFSDSDIQQIITMYSERNLSYQQIAKHFNVNPTVIRRVCKENGLKSRDNKFYRTKYSFNEDYFKDIDTEDKAYWLGFIYADGYITKGKKLGIKISNNDYQHLEKFKKCINSNHAINVYSCQGGYSKVENKFCQIELNSEKNVENLIGYGVLPRKSKILKFPVNIPHDLIRHFIRGYFDGDGSIYKSDAFVGVSFVGTKEFLIALKENLPINSVVEPYKSKNKDIYELKIGGGNILKAIYDYFYKESTIYLDRKYNKFTEIITELNNRRKKATLTIDDVKEIKKHLKEGIKQVDIARKFGISKTAVNLIAKGRSHAEVTV